MKLIKLEDGNVFYHKKLICIGRSAAYINELCRRYPVLERIEAVVDGDSRNQGEMVFSGKKIPVRDLSLLKKIYPTGCCLEKTTITESFMT